VKIFEEFESNVKEFEYDADKLIINWVKNKNKN